MEAADLRTDATRPRWGGWCYLAAVVAGLCVAVPASLGLGQEPPADAPRIHTVAPGETLGHISQRYYGTTRHWKRIAEANGISDPAAIRAGMRLTIPVLSAEDRRETAPSAPETPLGRAPDRPEDSIWERFEREVNRIIGRRTPWWVVALFPLVYGGYILVYWVGSNIVHMAQMSVGRAAVCALFTMLVWLACVVLGVFLQLALQDESGAGAQPRSLAIGYAILLLVLLGGSLVVIKFVYRDTVGKTAALWTVSAFLSLNCCAGPMGVAVAWLIPWLGG